MANEFRLLPGTLPAGYCLTDLQTFYNDMFFLGQVIAVNGGTFYNLGDTEPTPELRDYPWFRTLDGYWYFWSTAVGAWVRPHAVPASGGERRIWVGDLTALQTYDGGNAMAVGAASGPFWEQDTAFNGRLPIGVGTLPDSGDAITLLQQTGKDEQTLTGDQVGPHRHYIGVEGDLGIDDPAPEPGYLRTGAGEEVDWISSSNPPQEKVGQTREGGGDGDGVAEPFSILNPVIGVYFIRRTARIWALPI